MANKLRLAVLALATLLLSACVVAPAGRPYYRESVIVLPPQHGPRYFVAPPPPRWEHDHGRHGRQHEGPWAPKSREGRSRDHRGRHD